MPQRKLIQSGEIGWEIFTPKQNASLDIEAQIIQLDPWNRTSRPYTFSLESQSAAPGDHVLAVSDIDIESAETTSEVMSMATEADLRAAEIAAAEARGETKIARLEGKIDTAVATLLGEMRAIRDDVRQADQYQRDSRLFILGAILAGVLSLAALAFAMATYGDAIFGRGMNVRDVIQTTIKDTIEQQKRAAPTPPPAN
jgi:hypothetical protein